MNWSVLIAGVLAGFTTVGHFTMGSKLYLKPTLAAEFDAVARKINHCLFHYISVYLVLSTVALLALGAGCTFRYFDVGTLLFVGTNYALFAVAQLIIALTSGLERAPFKLFQWTFFALIALFTFIGLAYAG